MDVLGGGVCGTESALGSIDAMGLGETVGSLRGRVSRSYLRVCQKPSSGPL